MPAYACRILHHRLGDGTEHLDLLIRLPERDSLLTYEIKGDNIARFQHLLDRRGNPGWRLHTLAEGSTELLQRPNSVAIHAKADHRLLYWTYEGVVQGDRGTVRELVCGSISNRPRAEHNHLEFC